MSLDHAALGLCRLIQILGVSLSLAPVSSDFCLAQRSATDRQRKKRCLQVFQQSLFEMHAVLSAFLVLKAIISWPFAQYVFCFASYELREPLQPISSFLNACLGPQVFIIHGKQDRLVPASNSRRLKQMLPNAELLELDSCGHLPQEELPDQFIHAMKTFLAA